MVLVLIDPYSRFSIIDEIAYMNIRKSIQQLDIYFKMEIIASNIDTTITGSYEKSKLVRRRR